MRDKRLTQFDVSNALRPKDSSNLKADAAWQLNY